VFDNIKNHGAYVGLKLNCTYLVVYAGAVNVLGGSVHTIKKNTEILVVASPKWTGGKC
jgi:hypothetical protein